MKIGFLGCGNMGGALAYAASQNGENEILLCDKNEEKVTAMAQKTGGKTCTSDVVCAESDMIFLGVKPQFLADLFDEIRPLLAKRDRVVLVSMAAGVRMEKVLALCGKTFPLIRIMPNTPVAVGEGMILYTSSDDADDRTVDAFSRAMKAAGRFERLPESLIDAGCAVSGCGPAFMFMFARAVAEGGKNAGLSEQQSLLLAKQTMLGAAKLALEDSRTLDELIRAVCSPGGSTIEGVRVLENSDFDNVVHAALKASFDKTVALGK